MTRGGSTRAWRELRELILPPGELVVCALRWTGCTLWATHVDHIVPVSECPEREFDPSNLQPACASCNLRRGTKPALSPTGPAPSARWAMILE